MNDPIGLDSDTLAVTLAASALSDILGIEYLTALAMVEATRDAVLGSVKVAA